MVHNNQRHPPCCPLQSPTLPRQWLHHDWRSMFPSLLNTQRLQSSAPKSIWHDQIPRSDLTKMQPEPNSTPTLESHTHAACTTVAVWNKPHWGQEPRDDIIFHETALSRTKWNLIPRPMFSDKCWPNQSPHCLHRTSSCFVTPQPS